MTLRHQLKQIRLSKGSRTAIVKDGQTISFAQLSRYIEICQCNLPSSPTPVLIQVQCRLKAIILMLAAIERGYPFVPIDQDKSAASVADIIGNFPKILIINNLIPETGEIVYIWHGEEQTSSTIPSDVMSVMFTSGSTGKPKGVLVPSAAVENLLSSPSFLLQTLIPLVTKVGSGGKGVLQTDRLHDFLLRTKRLRREKCYPDPCKNVFLNNWSSEY